MIWWQPGDPVARLAAAPPDIRAEALRSLTHKQRVELEERWWQWANEGQREPRGDWRVWLIQAGRGFGKTRAGAEWVSQIARNLPDAQIALVGATIEDVRRVMIEGQSGLLTMRIDGERPSFSATRGEVKFGNGSIAYCYSAETPEKLRGPEHHAAWCDELAKWRNAEATWTNLMMTMRLGEAQRVIVTTTPRAVPVLKRVLATKGITTTFGRTKDNPHLPQSFVAAMLDEYGGTRIGRQELDGEMLDDAEGALWTRATIEACRVRAVPGLVRVVIGVDPPASAGGDACGIVCVGLGEDGIGYVIEDASVGGLSPEGWARAVAACAARRGADRVIAEKNQGGDMVRSVLSAADMTLPLRLVHASRGKVVRAEPVAALYEAGRVKHAGGFAALEDELCGLVAGGGYQGPGRSPDRADALVWALTEVMLGRRGRVRVRGI